jgi:hypothetical protein
VRIAFKEWAIIADALGTGRQIQILRKGGISEGRGGFQVDHPEFLLFPTLFHQQRQSVTEEAQRRYDEIEKSFPPEDILRVEYFCRVVSWRRLEDLSVARRLESQHIWRPEVIAERFDWGKGKAIFVLAVRTFRLPQAIDLPMLPAYGGCKSWIELERELDVSGAVPVLGDSAFTQSLQAFEQAVGEAVPLQ